jgi:altronate hydrolase
MKANVMVINDRDNVVVAVANIARGDTVSLPGGDTFAALADIPYGHKVACLDIADGREIIKYGESIGRAKGSLKKGEWIHIHNMIIEE